jgi:hypothetical protein
LERVEAIEVIDIEKGKFSFAVASEVKFKRLKLK